MLRKNLGPIVLGLLGFLAMTVAPARADVVWLDNTGVNNSKNQTLTLAGTSRVAVGFGMNGSFSLTSAKWVLGNPVGNPTITVSLYNSSGNTNTSVPTTPIAGTTLTNPTISGSAFQAYTFNAPTPINLVSGTAYWLVIQITGGTSIDVGGQENHNPVSNGIANYLDSANYNGLWTNLGSKPDYGFSISGTPEPATWLTGGLVAACTGLVALRKHRRGEAPVSPAAA
jgi:hypothetical protein